MQVINWLALQPQASDLEALNERLREALPLHSVCRLLVETTLRAYPWTGRADLILSYHPSQTYKPDQSIALLIPDTQNAQRGGNRFIWQLAQVKQTKMVKTPSQGRFQVLTLDVHGRQIQMAGGILNASYLEPDLAHLTPEDLAWLAEWVLETHEAVLQRTLKKLIEKGQLRGQLAGQIFLPESASTLSVEFLHPSFAEISAARPWTSPEDILKGLPDLAQLERERALQLIRGTLEASSYRPLGADRWTTPERFGQLDREVPRGLTTPRLRSKGSLWTKQDRQELTGYGRKSMPAEARRLLEDLDAGERLPEANGSAWRPPPPNTLLQLPPLNYLHITQAYVPVGYVLPAFAADVQMVFLQFIDGDHQPCLLDRENGLLKALHPEKWRHKILEDGIPAGTALWLEYEGKEKYRILPQLLPFKRRVPCKVAHLKEGQLHIEHTQISMKHKSSPFLFKADLPFEEAETLFAETNRTNLRVREAMIYAMQEICQADPDHRAHWSDLFNAVFLMRRCSPISIAFLLYTQPGFESLGGGYFRYKPAPEASGRKSHKGTERLSQLWENLLLDPVAPVPLAIDRQIAQARLEVSAPVSSSFAPNPELSFFLSQPETKLDVSVTALPLAAVESDAEHSAPSESTGQMSAGSVSTGQMSTGSVSAGQMSTGSVSTGQIYAGPGPTGLVSTGPGSAEEPNPEQEESSSLPFEDTSSAEFSFFTPTLGLDPKPAWIHVPAGPNPPATGTADARHLVYKPKIPLRPLHKQPFYRRLFFYLRAWLNRRFRKTL